MDSPQFSSDYSQLKMSVLSPENELNLIDIPTIISPRITQLQTKTANLQSNHDNNFIRPVQHQNNKRKRVMELDSII